MNLTQEDADRLAEIRDAIGDLVAEAAELLRGAPLATQHRAETYWQSQIERALGNDAEEGATFDPAGTSMDATIAEVAQAVVEAEQGAAAEAAQ